MPGSRAASGLPLVLPARSRRQGSAPLDVLGEPAGPLPRERSLPPHLRARREGVHGAGLVKGEGFAVDASVMEANASRYHGKAPDEIDWTETERQTRAVAEYLAALDAEANPIPTASRRR